MVHRLRLTENGTGYVDQRTGALLAQEQLKSFLVYGGEKVVFEKEEIAEIKKLQPPGVYSFLQMCECIYECVFLVWVWHSGLLLTFASQEFVCWASSRYRISVTLTTSRHPCSCTRTTTR